MQYSTILLSAALAATSVFAAPTTETVPKDNIRVQLAGPSELATQTGFIEKDLPTSKTPVGSNGPYNEVTLTLDETVQKKDLRCQIWGNSTNKTIGIQVEEPIVIVRGENTDITFADGGNGKWTFRDGDYFVSKIECNPKFVKADPSTIPPPPAQVPDEQDEDDLIIVTLSFDGQDALPLQFKKEGLEREVVKVESHKEFNTITVKIGQDVEKKDLRCKVVDENRHKVTATRGDNVDTTFADGGAAAPWTFSHPKKTQVSKVVCDPTFVKAAQ